MAAIDLSKTFDEMESDELSLETSVPTDLTLSPDRENGHAEDRRDRKSKVTRQLIERKQLMHDMQLLRIELSQKNLTLENMKAESLNKVEELEEKLNDALHQKQILAARLESQLAIQEQESKRRQDLIKGEMEEVRQRQKHLEATNERLEEKAGNVRRTLRDLTLTEDKYYELRGQSEEDLSLRDYVAMKLFEAVRPLQTEIDQMRLRNKTLEDQNKSFSKEVLELQEKLDAERQEHGELRIKYQKMVIDFSDTKSQVKHDNFKVENYDRVKSEKDGLEQDRLDIQRQFSVLEGSHQTLTKERDDLHSELSAAKQSLSLLKQDKEYLTKQVSDLTNRCTYAEEKVQQSAHELEDAKRAREEMYEKYVSSRDQYKTEYENKLREELEQIRLKTNGEIDRLRTSTKEMYERENRNLREARDMAISEKDRAIATERETSTKYEQLLTEFRQVQMHGDSKTAELQNEMKLKSFELERLQMVHEEMLRNLSQAKLDIEKLEKKAEVLTKEYYTLQAGMDKKVAELETQMSEKNAKIQMYERVEKELDEVVLQAAQVEDDQEAEKVLFSYGYGANVPTTSKRRLEQSVHLARRVLALEKINTQLRQDLEREKTKIKQLAEELKSSNSILDQAQQPYNYLIDSIRQRDVQMNKLKEHIANLEADVQQLEKERNDLVRTKNNMSLDLERLLNQKEEMSVMKQVVMNLSNRQYGEKKTKSRDLARPKSPSLHKPFGSFEPHDEPEVVKPGFITVTNDKSHWSKKLKQKNVEQSTKFSKVYATAKS
ncbi:progesterone-induced-blocking factor 1-like isoform X2 [Saccostrea echinata]|uniref:progesterone-induced-blocking factor 1-like isoform X2 n=1 Tax=Saccostrea echinata TaxID=191078 RepID=UPI002A81AF11|nr:progesterone-induced-blocking factor 1-like isoform X2 [Saccostrea echinata]